MQKQAIFQAKLLPYALVAPQLAIVLIFFYWPAGQAVIQSFLLQDAFGLSTSFVWFDNYIELFKDPAYFEAIVRTFVFSFAIAVSSLSFALLLAVMADKPLRGSTLYRTLLIWPYAVAPPVVGVLWIFMLHPSLGVLARYLRAAGVDWNPLLDGNQAAALIILAGTVVTFNLPKEGIAVLLGVDAILDMARTSINVLGNCLASAVVARWEGYKL